MMNPAERYYVGVLDACVTALIRDKERTAISPPLEEFWQLTRDTLEKAREELRQDDIARGNAPKPPLG